MLTEELGSSSSCAGGWASNKRRLSKTLGEQEQAGSRGRAWPSHAVVQCRENCLLAHCWEGLPFKGQKVEGGRTTPAGEAGTSGWSINCCPIIAQLPGASRGNVCACVARECGDWPAAHCPAQPGDTAPCSYKDIDFLLPFGARSDELPE